MAADGTRVLVTGAGGFVMSVFIADLLVRDPAAGVTALDAAPLDAAAKAHFARFGDRITFLQCDVRDREALQLEIGKVRPMILINAATVTHVPAWEYERPHLFIDVNIGGSLNVLEAARAAGSLGRVVHVGSCAVYGHGDPDAAPVLQGEAGPFHPADLYGVGKLGGEFVARRFSELHGISTAVVRFTRVFGPMERPTGARKLMHLPYLMMKKMLAGRPLRVTRRSADAVGDWISSEDVSDAIVKLCGSQSANRAYNIATGQPVRTTEVWRKRRSRSNGSMTAPRRTPTSIPCADEVSTLSMTSPQSGETCAGARARSPSRWRATSPGPAKIREPSKETEP